MPRHAGQPSADRAAFSTQDCGFVRCIGTGMALPGAFQTFPGLHWRRNRQIWVDVAQCAAVAEALVGLTGPTFGATPRANIAVPQTPERLVSSPKATAAGAAVGIAGNLMRWIRVRSTGVKAPCIPISRLLSHVSSLLLYFRSRMAPRHGAAEWCARMVI